MRIVGVVRSAWFSDSDGRPGALIATAAIYERYPTNIIDPKSGSVNALVRLRGGESALPRFRAELARVSGRSDIDTWNMHEQARALERTLRFEASCLFAFAAAALVAAMLLIGQAIARYTSASVEDLRTLSALGMTPRQSVLAASAGPVISATCGALLGVAAAVGASRWFPIGSATPYEPSPGLAADWAVMLPGLVLVPVVVLLCALASAWLSAGAHLAGLRDRHSVIASSVARAGLPVPVTVGTRLALETGRGPTAVPVRPALVGAVTGVIGVLAAFTFAGGVSDAASNPRRFGQTHHIETFLGHGDQDFGPARPKLEAVAAHPDVTGVNDGRVDVADAADGKTTIPLYSYDPVGRPLDVVVTAGQLPKLPNDVLIAPVTADALGAGVGDDIRLKGRQTTRSMKVVGIGFVPEGAHNSYSAGGYVTAAGYKELFGEHFKFHLGFVSLREGADPGSVLAGVKAAADAVEPGSGAMFDIARPPPAVRQVQQVQRFPLVLGVFLALLAIGTVGHALAAAVRRRRHDLAVLRALGMTRRQTRGVVVTQASVLALVGLLFGLPLGLALGRTVWRVVADYTPLQYEPPLVVWALLLIGPAALVVCNLLAAWPGRQASRLRISHILRTE
jgi:ABC-type lipoprotein release transport system permease subunit